MAKTCPPTRSTVQYAAYSATSSYCCSAETEARGRHSERQGACPSVPLHRLVAGGNVRLELGHVGLLSAAAVAAQCALQQALPLGKAVLQPAPGLRQHMEGTGGVTRLRPRSVPSLSRQGAVAHDECTRAG